jgi:hypothetical protein
VAAMSGSQSITSTNGRGAQDVKCWITTDAKGKIYPAREGAPRRPSSLPEDASAGRCQGQTEVIQQR